MALPEPDASYGSAELYDLINDWKDYRAEAAGIARIVEERLPGARTLLDVGCGTGNHLEHLAKRFTVEGSDINAGMLGVARTRLPGIPLHLVDMLELRLGRPFDVVTCLFGVVAHLVTVERLERSIARLAEHARPGGLVLVEPWVSAEAFEGDGIVGARTTERPGLVVARVHRTRRDGATCELLFGYQTAGPDGIAQHTETHAMGLFSERQYREALEHAALDVEFDAVGPMGRGLLIGRRREDGAGAR